ncbi:oxaloacetate decarboxylase [Guyparkeria sp.]|uniref:isocitrate lyase/PEP mutase family protein n=1 Tax=Guyparkeria sp. TaxID=2035736 RepID=UPI0039707674
MTPSGPPPGVSQKRAAFRELHQSGCFVLPNPWDAGSAKMLAGLGFKALATTSSGYAWSCGRADGQLSRAETLAHLRAMVDATDLPVNADFESGFAGTAEGVAESVGLAVETGVAGISIEDSTGDPNRRLRAIGEAAERIGAARAAIDANGGDTVLVGRAENFFVGCSDLDDTLVRLQAYAEAGADCLYAPGIKTPDEIRAVMSAVAPKPVNVLIGWDSDLSVQDLADLGVRRISLGGALARAGWGGFMQAARSIAEQGRFDGLANVPSGAELNSLFGKQRGPD